MKDIIEKYKLTDIDIDRIVEMAWRIEPLLKRLNRNLE